MAPTAAPQEVIVTYIPGSAEAIICSYPWPCHQALCIVRRESNFRADAVNHYDGDAKGWWQIRESVHASKWADWYTGWYDGARNTQYAWELYQAQGWGPWYAQRGVCW